MLRPVVIDACCVLNLLATRREIELVAGAGLTLIMSEKAHAEALFLSTPPDDEGVRIREPASTSRLRDAGSLSTHAIDSDALLDAFVECARLLRDADASCVALAVVLGLPLVTDDRKEQRIARGIFPQIEVISTLDVLHEAIRALALPTPDVLQIAADLRWRGNFAPPRKDPRADWYSDLLRQAGVPFP
jgi:predicted nucleic acid-binding protein